MLDIVIIIIGSLVLVTCFCILIVFADAGADIAEMKGHGRSPWWAWCFWTGIAGMVIVAALPDRAQPEHPTIRTEKFPNQMQETAIDEEMIEKFLQNFDAKQK